MLSKYAEKFVMKMQSDRWQMMPIVLFMSVFKLL